MIDNSLMMFKEIPEKRIEIILRGINPNELEDVNISFRDSKPYISKTKRNTDGSMVTVYEPVCGEDENDND